MLARYLPLVTTITIAAAADRPLRWAEIDYVAKGGAIQVQLKDGSKVSGKFARADDTALYLESRDRSTSVDRVQIRRIGIRGKGQGWRTFFTIYGLLVMAGSVVEGSNAERVVSVPYAFAMYGIGTAIDRRYRWFVLTDAQPPATVPTTGSPPGGDHDWLL